MLDPGSGANQDNHQPPPALSTSPSTNHAGPPLSPITARVTPVTRYANGSRSPSSNNTTNNRPRHGFRPALAIPQKLVPAARPRRHQPRQLGVLHRSSHRSGQT